MARRSERGLGESESSVYRFRVPNRLLIAWNALVAAASGDEPSAAPKQGQDVLRDVMAFLVSEEWRGAATSAQSQVAVPERKSALGVFYAWMKAKGGVSDFGRPKSAGGGGEGAVPLPTPYPMAVLRPEPGAMKRLNLGLKPSELAAVSAIAEERGCSPQWWIVSLIRAALTRGITVGGAELKALAESNYQLMALGRNLNQIAHHINADPSKHDMLRLTAITELTKQIDAHRTDVRELIYACSERWEIR